MTWNKKKWRETKRNDEKQKEVTWSDISWRFACGDVYLLALNSCCWLDSVLLTAALGIKSGSNCATTVTAGAFLMGSHWKTMATGGEGHCVLVLGMCLGSRTFSDGVVLQDSGNYRSPHFFCNRRLLGPRLHLSTLSNSSHLFLYESVCVSVSLFVQRNIFCLQGSKVNAFPRATYIVRLWFKLLTLSPDTSAASTLW